MNLWVIQYSRTDDGSTGEWQPIYEDTFRNRLFSGPTNMTPRPLEDVIERAAILQNLNRPLTPARGYEAYAKLVSYRIRNIATGEIIPTEVFAGNVLDRAS